MYIRMFTGSPKGSAEDYLEPITCRQLASYTYIGRLDTQLPYVSAVLPTYIYWKCPLIQSRTNYNNYYSFVLLSHRFAQRHCAWRPSVLHPTAIWVHHWPRTGVCSTLLWGPWTVGKPLQPHFWQVYLCHCTLQCWSGQHWNECHHQDWCEDSRDQRYLSLCEGWPWQLQC